MEQNLIEFDELMIDYLTGSLSEENTGKFYTLLQSDMLYQRRYDELAKLHAQSFIYNPQIEMFARFKMKSSFHKTKRII